VKLYVLPPSPRAFKVIALNHHLGLDCKIQVVDLGHDAHLTPEYGALNPNRKMPVLNEGLRGRKWLAGDALTIADFALGAWMPSIQRLQLPVAQYANILRWYDGLAALSAWQASTASVNEFMQAMEV